jgi:hypothetical protein
MVVEVATSPSCLSCGMTALVVDGILDSLAVIRRLISWGFRRRIDSNRAII